jgi:hypothetical protein
MSETVRMVGKLKKSELSLEQMAEKIKEKYPKSTDNVKLETQENLKSFVKDYLWGIDEYTMLNGELYEVLQINEFDISDDYVDIEHQDDGTIKFSTQFYTGGTYWEEMVEEGLRLHKKESD